MVNEIVRIVMYEIGVSNNNTSRQKKFVCLVSVSNFYKKGAYNYFAKKKEN